MVKIIKTQTRPNPNIPFYEEINDSPPSYKGYVYENYVKNKKMLSIAVSLSEDKLTQTTTMMWESVDAFLDFCTDEFCINEYLHIVLQYEVCNQIETDVILSDSN